MYFRKKTSGGRAYLQIVESRREGALVRQQVIATLGRVEDLQASGQLERLLRSGARFAAKAIVWTPLPRARLRRARRGASDPHWCSNDYGRRPAAGKSSRTSPAPASMILRWSARCS